MEEKNELSFEISNIEGKKSIYNFDITNKKMIKHIFEPYSYPIFENFRIELCKEDLINLSNAIFKNVNFDILKEITKIQHQKTISEYCKEAHETAKEKGFYDEKPNIPTLLMLIVSELSEALEADRKISNFTDNIESGVLKLDAYTHFEEEIADTFIRLFDLCGYLNIDIEKVIKMKMEKNKERPRKHGKRY